LRFQTTDHPLRTARKRARLTLHSLGAASKIHPTKLWQLEMGLYAREDELLRLARVLRCKPSDLIPKQSNAADRDQFVAAGVRA